MYPPALPWEDGLHTFTQCAFCPSRLAKRDQRGIVVIFGRIDNCQFFFFLYRYCFYIIAPSAPEQMFYWVLLAMILF